MNPRDRLIFALDVNSTEEALDLVRRLAGEVGIFKVGLELFVAEGPAVLEQIGKAGARALFLDLKLNDIPATMCAAAKTASGLGVDYLTCHCEQAGIFEGLDLGRTRLLAVTVLTSLGPEDLKAMGYPPPLQDPRALVLHRARLALAAGAAGVVCSGHEAADVRQALGPQALVVCPGIRPAAKPGASADDQKRIVTPEQALAAGASHIVVGRSIRRAGDPVQAARQVVEGIKAGLAQECCFSD
ncbi:Orotidine 5'-phosphate decarboxylase [Desulfarculales bacterium]